MEFRPCIDIHNGRVKQIVGGSLSDENNFARENFVSEMGAGDYAGLYKRLGLRGGHIILLNARDSEYYQADLAQAKEALAVWSGALEIGGGITVENAASFLDMGASHVIVTSYVFADGKIRFDRLDSLVAEVGREHLVLDLSCREKEGQYYVVTDRWQKFTRQPFNEELLERLSGYCDEFLVHAVNVEGTGMGVDKTVLQCLAKHRNRPVTYAGGIGSLRDIETIAAIGEKRINYTVGSALDLFGGSLKLEEIISKY